MTDILKETEKNLGGRTPAFTEKDIPRILEALEVNNGFKAPTARSLRVSVTTLNKYIEMFPVLKDKLDDLKQGTIDEVHENVLDRIRNHEQGSHLLAMFYLKTQAGWRETHHVVSENHNFNFEEAIKSVADERPEIVEGFFTDDYTGWD